MVFGTACSTLFLGGCSENERGRKEREEKEKKEKRERKKRLDSQQIKHTEKISKDRTLTRIN